MPQFIQSMSTGIMLSIFIPTLFIAASLLFAQIYSVYKMSCKVGVKHAWLSFIPFAHVFAFGKVAERLEAKNAKKIKFGIGLIVLTVLEIAFAVVLYVLSVLRLNHKFSVVWIIIAAIATIVVSILYLVKYYKAYYRILNIFGVEDAKPFAIITFTTFGLASPFFLFALCKKEPQYSVKKELFEPVFKVVKRDDMPGWMAWTIRFGTVAIAYLVVGLISMSLSKQSLSETYDTIFLGAFGRIMEGSKVMLYKFLHDVAILLALSLALTPAFKMKFWNCGAEGQALIGGLATMICILELGDTLPYPAMVAVIAVSSIVAGAIWGLIPALFKSFFNTNETLFTLMMNYVATQIVKYYLYIKGGGSNKINPVEEAGTLGTFPAVGENEYFVNTLIVVVLMVAMFIYLKYSKQGYEISVVGESQNTARYVGINVKKVIIRTMIISGALCGITGMLLVAGKDRTITENLVQGQGFTAILMSWLGQFNPFFMAIMISIITYFSKGTARVANLAELDASFSEIIVGIVILMLVACEFFIHYSIKYHGHAKKEAKA